MGNTRKIIAAVLAVFVALAISGCGSKKLAVAASFPDVGEVATRNIGDTLLIQGYLTTVPSLIISEKQQLGDFQIRAGTYPMTSDNKEGKYFEAAFGKDGPEEVQLRAADGKFCIEKACTDLAHSMGRVAISADEKSFQQSLLYNGKIGNKVTLSYREFVNGTARPAFTNEVSYDLNDSNIIGYKGARLEVIRATNTDITFKVLSVFN